MFKEIKKTVTWGGREIELSTGKLANQATGACVARMGDTMVLCTVVAAQEAKEGVDFFPLTVNYLEKFYAVGAVPGGFFKRESKPSEREVLTSRLIDRPIRPMFADGFYNEVQIICKVLSYDKEHESDVLAMIGASAAIAISGIPFVEPIAAARVGYIDGEYVLNPLVSEMDNSKLNLMVAGTENSVLMVESEAQQLTEEEMLGAVIFGQKNLKPVIDLIKELEKEVGKPKWSVDKKDDSEIIAKLENQFGEKLKEAYKIVSKSSRKDAIKVIKDDALAMLSDLSEGDISSSFKSLEKKIVRAEIIKNKSRIDGRSPDEIRPISCEVDLLPKAHASALFMRGETQVLSVTTLGTKVDEQMVDDISGNKTERFLLHYNFPPYSVGEIGVLRAPGRREIGHGKLAHRAISAVLPDYDSFPYTIRVVSEVTSCNGSSSMATVCGATLSLMSCGVPLKAPVSGIAMGLIKEGEDYVILSDIMGDEDHLGDMDFKVTGTEQGITALQMDIKINGVSEAIMSDALLQAKAGRSHILSKMLETISEPRANLNANAPKMTIVQVAKDKIRDLIGPGGKMIKEICEKSKAKVDISDDGTVNVAASNSEQMEIALKMIADITAVPEVGKIYEGIVTKITDFGAFVRYMGNSEGLVHISEIADHKIARVSDFVNEGSDVKVKLIGIERGGKVRLSMKGLNDAILLEGKTATAIIAEDGDAEVEIEISSDKEKKNHRSSSRRKFEGDRSKRNDKGSDRSRGADRDRSEGKPKSDEKNKSVDKDKKRRFF